MAHSIILAHVKPTAMVSIWQEELRLIFRFLTIRVYHEV